MKIVADGSRDNGDSLSDISGQIVVNLFPTMIIENWKSLIQKFESRKEFENFKPEREREF